jgi:hypothetical protein
MSETSMLIALVIASFGGGWFLRARYDGARAWPAPPLPGDVRDEVRRVLESAGFTAATDLLTRRYGFTPTQAKIAVGPLERLAAPPERRLTRA